MYIVSGTYCKNNTRRYFLKKANLKKCGLFKHLRILKFFISKIFKISSRPVYLEKFYFATFVKLNTFFKNILALSLSAGYQGVIMMVLKEDHLSDPQIFSMFQANMSLMLKKSYTLPFYFEYHKSLHPIYNY